MVPSLAVRTFQNGDRAVVVNLWERCELTRSWNNPGLDINRKVEIDPGGFLVGTVAGDVVATVMAGYDGHRGWINYLAVDPACRGAGYGAQIMVAAQKHLAALGCPKINLQIRTTNTEAAKFYESIGYKTDDVVSMSLRLIDDETP